MAGSGARYVQRMKELSRRFRDQGPAELAHRARIANRRRVQARRSRLPDGLTPLAPLGFAETLAGIRDHYLLDVSHTVTWNEQELQRDLRRLASLPAQAKVESELTTVLIVGGHETRRTLACLESLLSWPDSRSAHIVLADIVPSSDAIRIAAAIQSVAVLAGSPDECWWARALLTAQANESAQIFVVPGDALVCPGWLDALEFQLGRPGIGIVGARVTDFPELDRRRPSESPATTHDVRSVLQSWGMRAETWSSLDLVSSNAQIGASTTELCDLVRRRGKRAVIASDGVVLAKRRRTDSDRVSQARISELGHDHSDGPKRQIVVASDIPKPDVDSGSEDAYWLIRHLADLSCAVTVVIQGEPVEDEYVWSLRRLGARVEFVQGNPQPGALNAAVAASDGLIAINGSQQFKFIQSARSGAGSRIPLVYLPLDLRNPIETVSEAAAFVGDLGERFFEDSNASEIAAAEAADFAGVISLAELEYLRSRDSAMHAFLLPMLRSDPDRDSPNSNSEGIVAFVGGFKHPPNYVSAEWFISEVWPLVTANVPSARLRIYGSNLPEQYRAEWSASGGVEVVGRYLNAADPYRDATVVVAPMLLGGGVNGKVVTALGHGMPVVGTSVAACGLPEDVANCIRIADNSRDMAEAVCELLTDERTRNSMTSTSVRAYDRHYSQAAGRQAVSALIQLLDGSHPTEGGVTAR